MVSYLLGTEYFQRTDVYGTKFSYNSVVIRILLLKEPVFWCFLHSRTERFSVKGHKYRIKTTDTVEQNIR